ncbi:hypothetical protein GCM10011609_53540 [Lentzea pudingi]|uniref:Uncharacterized protein n=1 Tax=Lentzea pudingi TaxID=1789439 RepID=A0ABQ2IGS8_9PSEU|nr:hypothetical protein [Lentzea pudingi]GGN07323.1 hypothetical protein GCM10011609_53540 [Lentzea pudingi]
MNTKLRDRLLRLNVDLAATRLSTEDAIRLACDLLVAEVDMPAVVELASASVRSTCTPDAALLTVLWSFGLELDNVDLLPGALSLEEIISTADAELTRWTA